MGRADQISDALTVCCLLYCRPVPARWSSLPGPIFYAVGGSRALLAEAGSRLFHRGLAHPERLQIVGPRLHHFPAVV